MAAQSGKAFENHNIPIMIEFITLECMKKSLCLYLKPGNTLGKAFFFFF